MTESKEQLIEVYNEAHLVFLFDEAAAEDVRGADSLLFEGAKPFQAKKFEPLFADHRLLIYDLFQDDPVELRVLIGAPIPEEDIGVKVLPPAVSSLSLPTGRLRVETLNTLSPGSGDEAGLMQVPPGDYQVTLYRIDWQNADVEHEDVGWIETIVLTPLGAQDDRPPSAGFICRHGPEHDCAGTKVAP